MTPSFDVFDSPSQPAGKARWQTAGQAFDWGLFALKRLALCLIAPLLLASAVAAGQYYLQISWPADTFAQLQQAPWATDNATGWKFQSLADFHRAKRHLEQLIATPQQAQNPMPHYLLAELYMALNQSQPAERQYQTVLQLSQRDGWRQMQYRYFTENAHAALALLAYEANRLEPARQHLAQIEDWEALRAPNLAAALQDSLENPQRADFHFELGKQLRQEFKLSHAIQEIQRAEQTSQSPQLRLDAQQFLRLKMPQHVRQLSPLGRYYSLAGKAYQSRQDDFPQAARFYEQALREAPGFEWDYNELAIVYRAMRQYPKAEQSALAAIRLNPLFYHPYLTLGDLALDQQQYAHAIQCFLQARQLIAQAPRIDDEYTTLLANLENQLGFAYESLQNAVAARQHYQQALWMTQQTTSSDEAVDDYEYAREGLLRVQ